MMKSISDILIVGAGAIGCYYGARLLEASNKVTFLCHEKRKKELDKNGLNIKSSLGNYSTRKFSAITKENIETHFDLIIYACKSYALREAIQDSEEGIGEGTVLMPMLNGMTHIEYINELYPLNTIYGGSCFLSVSLTDRETVTHWNPDAKLFYGPANNASLDVKKKMRGLWGKVKGKNVESNNIIQNLWDKWVFLTTFAGITCVLRASVGEIIEAGGTPVVDMLYKECSDIADNNGYKVDEETQKHHLSVLTNCQSELTSSMLKDMKLGKPIESEHIFGDLISKKYKNARKPLLDMCYLYLKLYGKQQSKR